MWEYLYLVIHSAATFPEMIVSQAVLDEWHKGPRDNEDGTVTYMGKTYPSRDLLPNDFLNGRPVRSLKGRGWDRYGYRDIYHRDGSVENITPYVKDAIITSAEMTWGATGVNRNSVHICLEGGRLRNRPMPKFVGAETILFTPEQIESLTNTILSETATFPKIRVAGHYQFTNTKMCPGFDIPAFMKKIGREKYAYKP